MDASTKSEEERNSPESQSLVTGTQQHNPDSDPSNQTKESTQNLQGGVFGVVCKFLERNKWLCLICLGALVVIGIVLGVKLSRPSGKEDKHSMESQMLVAKPHKQVDEQIDPLGVCNPNRCIERPFEIPGRKRTVEEKFCREPHTTDHRFKCNGTYLTLEYLRQNINKQIFCYDSGAQDIFCCQIKLASADEECSDQGKLVCSNNTSIPFCVCTTGWQGANCEELYWEKVVCKCVASTEIFVGEKTWNNCSNANRPENWTLCLHDFHNGTKCACSPSYHAKVVLSTVNGSRHQATSQIITVWMMAPGFGFRFLQA